MGARHQAAGFEVGHDVADGRRAHREFGGRRQCLRADRVAFGQVVLDEHLEQTLGALAHLRVGHSLGTGRPARAPWVLRPARCWRCRHGGSRRPCVNLRNRPSYWLTLHRKKRRSPDLRSGTCAESAQHSQLRAGGRTRHRVRRRVDRHHRRIRCRQVHPARRALPGARRPRTPRRDPARDNRLRRKRGIRHWQPGPGPGHPGRARYASSGRRDHLPRSSPRRRNPVPVLRQRSTRHPRGIAVDHGSTGRCTRPG